MQTPIATAVVTAQISGVSQTSASASLMSGTASLTAQASSQGTSAQSNATISLPEPSSTSTIPTNLFEPQSEKGAEIPTRPNTPRPVSLANTPQPSSTQPNSNPTNTPLIPATPDPGWSKTVRTLWPTVASTFLWGSEWVDCLTAYLEFESSAGHPVSMSLSWLLSLLKPYRRPPVGLAQITGHGQSVIGSSLLDHPE